LRRSGRTTTTSALEAGDTIEVTTTLAGQVSVIEVTASGGEF
jgi:hypothetical protein